MRKLLFPASRIRPHAINTIRATEKRIGKAKNQISHFEKGSEEIISEPKTKLDALNRKALSMRERIEKAQERQGHSAMDL